jgi:hypothetical protein
MFDGPVRTSEWVWAGRFAWVGQQGCQATRHAPQTVASKVYVTEEHAMIKRTLAKNALNAAGMIGRLDACAGQ